VPRPLERHANACAAHFALQAMQVCLPAIVMRNESRLQSSRDVPLFPCKRESRLLFGFQGSHAGGSDEDGKHAFPCVPALRAPSRTHA
jgi:hypothetical protein